MAQAFLKLFAITAITLILSFLVVVGLRSIYSQGSYAEPSNPWFEKKFWWVFEPKIDELCREAGVEELLPTKGWIVVLPLKRQEEDWVIPCSSRPALLLKHYLAKSPHQDWILKVTVHDTWALDTLVDITNAEPATHKRFGLIADAQKVAVYLRKKAPQWLFAADPSSLVRFRLFESLWLEAAVEFWPDFLITSPRSIESVQLDARGYEEMHRRKRRVLWEMDENPSVDPPFAVDGVLTNRPSAAQQKFNSRL